jgi:hypothetical protein
MFRKGENGHLKMSKPSREGGKGTLFRDLSVFTIDKPYFFKIQSNEVKWPIYTVLQFWPSFKIIVNFLQLNAVSFLPKYFHVICAWSHSEFWRVVWRSIIYTYCNIYMRSNSLDYSTIYFTYSTWYRFQNSNDGFCTTMISNVNSLFSKTYRATLNWKLHLNLLEYIQKHWSMHTIDQYSFNNKFLIVIL